VSFGSVLVVVGSVCGGCMAAPCFCVVCCSVGSLCYCSRVYRGGMAALLWWWIGVVLRSSRLEFLRFLISLFGFFFLPVGGGVTAVGLVLPVVMVDLFFLWCHD
jgi:hypothetical protein